MKPSAGVPITSHSLMTGVIRGTAFGGQYRKAREKQHPLKNLLQNSRHRKAPITLATTPFDHRGER